MACYHSAIFYKESDYEGFDTPIAEGGKGPENAREVLGLEFWHDYDFAPVPLLPSETVEQAAYRHVCATHHFLTADNHTWGVVKAERPYWGSRVIVTKNANSGHFAWKPRWVEDGPGALWFSLKFRLATVGMITAEIAADRRRTQRYIEEADSQHDSIRGRKRARQLCSFAHSSRWLADVAPGRRWPQLASSAGASACR